MFIETHVLVSIAAPIICCLVSLCAAAFMIVRELRKMREPIAPKGPEDAYDPMDHVCCNCAHWNPENTWPGDRRCGITMERTQPGHSCHIDQWEPDTE